MSGFKRFRRFGGNVHFKRNQVLLIYQASKILLESGSVDDEVRMQTSISGSISHVTEVEAGYQQEKDGQADEDLDHPGGRRA